MKYSAFLSRWGITMLIVGIAIGAPLGAAVWPKEKIIVREGTPDTPAAISSVNVMIDYGDGRIKTWNTISHHEAMSALNVLETLHSTQNVVLTVALGTNGKPAVTAIDGITNDSKSGRSWHYFVNNIREPRDASKYFLRPGDIVVWAYAATE